MNKLIKCFLLSLIINIITNDNHNNDNHHNNYNYGKNNYNYCEPIKTRTDQSPNDLARR